MGATPTRTANRYYIGSVANAGLQYRDGYALYEAASSRYSQYTAVTNVQYLDSAQSIILTPSPSLVDNALASYSYTAGKFTTCIPEGRHETHLYMFDATAAIATYAQTTATMRVDPSFMVSFVRADARPDGQTDYPDFAITLTGVRPDTGAAYTLTLTWGVYTKPTLAYIDREGAAHTDTYTLQDSEMDEYAFSPRLTWWFYRLGNDLYILCSALSTPWIIRDIAGAGYPIPQVPRCTFKLSASAGMVYAFNMSPITFATTGTFDTPYVDYFFRHDWADASDYYYPTPATGTVSATPLLYGGFRQQYRVTLTGDGYHTPALAAWQVYYRPKFNAQTDTWTELTNYVSAMDSPAEVLPYDTSGHTLDISFDNSSQKFAQYLAASDPSNAYSYTAGNALIKWQTGIVYSDGSTVTDARGYGVIGTREQITGVGEQDKYRISVKDRSSIYADNEAFAAPCLLGFPPEEAIAVLAEYAGVYPSDIVIEAAVNDNTKEAGMWYTRGSSPSFGDEVLDDPQRSYDQPPWKPTDGSRVWDTISQIADRYKLIAEFRGDGKLHITGLETYPTATVTYSTESGTDRDTALAHVSRRREPASAPNVIIAKGADADGKPVYGTRWEPSSITTAGQDGFIGYLKRRIIVDENLKTKDSAKAAAGRAFAEREGRPLLETSAPYAGWNVWPRERINVLDVESGSTPATEYRVRDINITHGDVTLETTMTLERISR